MFGSFISRETIIKCSKCREWRDNHLPPNPKYFKKNNNQLSESDFQSLEFKTWVWMDNFWENRASNEGKPLSKFDFFITGSQSILREKIIKFIQSPTVAFIESPQQAINKAINRRIDLTNQYLDNHEADLNIGTSSILSKKKKFTLKSKLGRIRDELKDLKHKIDNNLVEIQEGLPHKDHMDYFPDGFYCLEKYSPSKNRREKKRSPDQLLGFNDLFTQRKGKERKSIDEKETLIKLLKKLDFIDDHKNWIFNNKTEFGYFIKVLFEHIDTDGNLVVKRLNKSQISKIFTNEIQGLSPFDSSMSKAFKKLESENTLYSHYRSEILSAFK